MFNMRGHTIEFTGLFDPTPGEIKEEKECGFPVSDFSHVKKLLKDSGGYDLKEADDISMVVWGEDLARIPLLVFDNPTDGPASCVFREDHFPKEALDIYEECAVKISEAMELEQANASDFLDELLEKVNKK